MREACSACGCGMLRCGRCDCLCHMDLTPDDHAQMQRHAKQTVADTQAEVMRGPIDLFNEQERKREPQATPAVRDLAERMLWAVRRNIAHALGYQEIADAMSAIRRVLAEEDARLEELLAAAERAADFMEADCEGQHNPACPICSLRAAIAKYKPVHE